MKKVAIAVGMGVTLVGGLLQGADMNHDFSMHKLRRDDLRNLIKQEHPNVSGAVFLFAGFEGECAAFQQEPSFFYFTGLKEPGIVVRMDLDGATTLYVPDFGGEREKWMPPQVPFTQENKKTIGVDEIKKLGQQGRGYQLYPFADAKQYEILTADLQKLVEEGGSIFTLCPSGPCGYVEQRHLLERMKDRISGLPSNMIDISSLVAQMRRRKDVHEIEQLYKAIEVTSMAHEAAAQAISNGVLESEVQASLEYVFIASGSRAAFPSIVASGKNSTVLHYHTNGDQMKDGDLVVIDIGADFGGYSADISRTYPVSGKFTERQKEIYNIVLETQEHIASIAQPGYWIKNPDQPEKSLHHLTVKFLEEKGYAKYFPHGIGHYLGLDTHDVGSYKTPLQEGDVITIEPGIYIPEESIGVRIEDDYWIVKKGAVCLSENLPKKAEDIEKMVQQGFGSKAFKEEAQGIVEN